MFFFMKNKKNLWPFFMDGVQLLSGGSLLFTKFPEITGTHFLSISEGQATQIPISDSKKGLSVLI